MLSYPDFATVYASAYTALCRRRGVTVEIIRDVQ